MISLGAVPLGKIQQGRQGWRPSLKNPWSLLQSLYIPGSWASIRFYSSDQNLCRGIVAMLGWTE